MLFVLLLRQVTISRGLIFRRPILPHSGISEHNILQRRVWAEHTKHGCKKDGALHILGFWEARGQYPDDCLP